MNTVKTIIVGGPQRLKAMITIYTTTCTSVSCRPNVTAEKRLSHSSHEHMSEKRSHIPIIS